ncbi:MAG TPA: hypothetical protein VFT99_04780, partial [Roseiflexaceae bacterium]|nr:hypothetical protein [Roseiflexaceae bacterium]
MTCLVNALAEPADPTVLIFDDYHTINLQAIHEAIAFLLDHMPVHMHIAMTTRADPPLPLARLRARVALAEVRAADLRFTHDETSDLFQRTHNIQLPLDAMASLEARTEGWAAGLQLAGLSLQHQDAAHMPGFLADFTGSHTYVFDYLADEVFQRQAASVQLFLMQSAILPRLCGALCSAVTGQHDAQTMLEQLDKANLFLVALDNRRHWYRYHQLFRDFLYNCLHRAVGSTGIAALHRRASAWFEQNGLAGEAVEHALSAQAWDDAARCLAPLMADQRFYEYFLDWPRWSDAFPDEVLQANLELCLRLARILILTGHIEHADRPLGLAEAIWQAAGDQARLAEVDSYRALALALRQDLTQAITL